MRLLSRALPALALIFFVSFHTAARKHARIASKTRFLDATVQRTIPGVQGAETFSEWKFLLIWDEAQAPESFFWHPDASKWLQCAVQRVHHYHKAREGNMRAYESEAIALQNVRRGDTLEIVPVPHRWGAEPKRPKVGRTGALYYKTKSRAAWHCITPALHKLPDMLMP